MRLDEPRTLHACALYALPVVVAWFGWGAGAALLASLVMALAGMALRLKAMRAAAAAPVGVLRLHTISYSHYTEKVRWCMDRLGVEYDEVPNIGILGVLLMGRTVPALELEQRFDRRIGNDVRVWAYSRIFRRRDLTLRTWRAEIESFRQRPAGQFALRMYRDERLRQPA